MIELREYLDAGGRSPYANWFGGLNAQAAAKVAIALTRLAQGNFSNVKGVSAGVFEYKLDFGPGYRIYFGKVGERLVIFAWWRHEKASADRHWFGASIVERLQTTEEIDTHMPLTQSFKKTILARAQRDPAFRRALLREGVECLLSGDLQTGKTVLRDYINSTIGFKDLAEATGLSSKSLMRMFGADGNPQARHIFQIVALLQRREGVRFAIKQSLSAA